MSLLILTGAIGTIFGLFMIYYTHLCHKRDELSWYPFWMVLWIGLIGISLFPKALDFISVALNFGRMDFFVVVGFIIILGIVFHLFRTVDKNKKNIEKVVSAMAIENGDK